MLPQFDEARTILPVIDPIPNIGRYEDALAELAPSGSLDAHLLRTLRGVEGTLLVLDASFNPPTIAHWSLIERGCQALVTQHAALVLSSTNVDKKVFGAPLPQRLAMMDDLAATRPSTAVAICRYARFVDKATALSPLFPNTRLVFAIGYDTLIRLFDEKYYTQMNRELEQLFDAAGFIVANRDTDDLSQTEAYLDDPTRRPFRDAIDTLSFPPRLASISSSEIRQRALRDERINDLVPAPVATFIQRHGLYSNENPR